MELKSGVVLMEGEELVAEVPGSITGDVERGNECCKPTKLIQNEHKEAYLVVTNKRTLFVTGSSITNTKKKWCRAAKLLSSGMSRQVDYIIGKVTGLSFSSVSSTERNKRCFPCCCLCPKFLSDINTVISLRTEYTNLPAFYTSISAAEAQTVIEAIYFNAQKNA